MCCALGHVPLARSRARSGVSHATGRVVRCARNWPIVMLGRDPAVQGPEKSVFAQFWVVHSVPNISTVDPKILGLNTKATHREPKTRTLDDF